jgi:peptidoglycan/xylan/chitin deacetylase (PgdA/CDA1 family)
MSRVFPHGAEFAMSLTYDVEMCTNFPYWTAVWDHRKGAIDADSKTYVGKLNDVAKKYGVKFQYFVLGSVLEDPDLDYLKRVVDDGNPIGNHTYHHLNVKAQTIDQLQVTYRMNPWWAGDRTPFQCIRDEIHSTTLAMHQCLGVEPAGFRTPGGFETGLHDVPAVQTLLRDEGFTYASSHYEFKIEKQRNPPSPALDAAARASVDTLQPYRYPSGLPEMPMMGLSDIWAFRVLDLDRREFLRHLLATIDHAHEHRQVLSLLFHPAVLAARDPFCEITETLVCHAIEKPGGCWIAGNDQIARAVVS